MNKEQFQEALTQARTRVFELQKIDGVDLQDPITIMFALEAGLRNPETGAQFDALVYLEELAKEYCARRKLAIAVKQN